MYTVGEKILAQRSPGPDPKVCYDNQYLIFTPSSVGFILWHSLSGIRNRSIKKLTRYRDEKPRRLDLPQREDLEKISPRFAVKFLLGVMNSATAHDFLRANRRSNIHLYPDDWKKLPIPDVPLEQQEPDCADFLIRVIPQSAIICNSDNKGIGIVEDEMSNSKNFKDYHVDML